MLQEPLLAARSSDTFKLVLMTLLTGCQGQQPRLLEARCCSTLWASSQLLASYSNASLDLYSLFQNQASHVVSTAERRTTDANLS